MSNLGRALIELCYVHCGSRLHISRETVQRVANRTGKLQWEALYYASKLGIYVVG